MANSQVQVAPDSTGKKIQCFLNTVGGQNVEAQAVALVDSSGNPNPTLPVTGPVTDTQLRATPLAVQVRGATSQITDVDSLGHLGVRIHDPTTAFGELSVAQPTPVVQLDWIYGINTLLTTSTVTGSGTVTSATSLAIVNTTANASSSAQIVSRRYIKYRSGQGGLGRFTALFTTGVAGSKQYCGLATTSLSDGYLFGYSGVTFGIWYLKGGTPTHIPQSTWNVDVMNGAGYPTNPSSMTLVPTNGNVYQIKYQYLGFGAIFFYVENQNLGEFTLVHVIKYANLNTTPNVLQPSLSYLMRSENDGSTATAISVSGATAALFVEGMINPTGPTYGRDNNKATVTTETNILSIRNCTTFNTITNRAQMRLRHVSFCSNTGGAVSGVVTFRLVLGTTLGGAPSFAATNGTTADSGVTITSGLSISSFDTAGTTVTGGTVIYNGVIAVGGSASIEISNLNLILAPGETLTLAVTSTQSATVGVGITWTEDL